MSPRISNPQQAIIAQALCISRVCLTALLVLVSSSLWVAHAAPSQALKEAYQEVYRAAESLVRKGDLKEAIRLYTGSLGELRDDGRVHLRLAQLYEQMKDRSKEASVAYHYLMCVRDQNMESMMRDQICQREVKARFSPLLVTGRPRSLEVLLPSPFAGPTAANAPLPNGPLKLRFVRRGATQPEIIDLQLPLRGPVNLGPRSFMPSRPKLTSSELLGAQPSAQGTSVGADVPPSSSKDPFALTQPQPNFQRSIQLPRWPAYTLFILSAAGLAVGTYTFINIQDFNQNMLGTELPVVLWASSGAAAILGGAWLAVSW